MALIDQREGDFAFGAEAVLLEFPHQALAVDGLQQSRPERSVDLDGEANDPRGQVGAWFGGMGESLAPGRLIGG